MDGIGSGFGCVLVGAGALYARYPGGDASGIRGATGPLAFGFSGLGLVLLSGALGPGVGGVLFLTLLSLFSSVLAVLLPSFFDRDNRRPITSRRRARFRHAWGRREVALKSTAGLIGGFMLFAAASLWFPLIARRLAGSAELGLALASMLTVPLWAFAVGASLIAASGLRAWTWVGAMTLGLTVTALWAWY